MSEKHWSDGLSDRQINDLRSTQIPFGLRSDWEKKALQAARDAGDVQRYDHNGWGHQHPEGNLERAYTYRLRPDFERPEKKKEKPGRWEICDLWVWQNEDLFESPTYWFGRGHRNYQLSKAPGMVGYGGIEYEEWPGEWCEINAMKAMNANKWQRAWAPFNKYADAIPATPKRVKFYIED